MGLRRCAGVHPHCPFYQIPSSRRVTRYPSWYAYLLVVVDFLLNQKSTQSQQAPPHRLLKYQVLAVFLLLPLLRFLLAHHLLRRPPPPMHPRPLPHQLITHPHPHHQQLSQNSVASQVGCCVSENERMWLTTNNQLLKRTGWTLEFAGRYSKGPQVEVEECQGPYPRGCASFRFR